MSDREKSMTFVFGKVKTHFNMVKLFKQIMIEPVFFSFFNYFTLSKAIKGH